MSYHFLEQPAGHHPDAGPGGRAVAQADVTTVRACVSSCTDPTHVVSVRTIGDKQDVWIPATPEHQEMVLSTEASDYWARYEHGRDEGQGIVRRLEGTQ